MRRNRSTVALGKAYSSRRRLSQPRKRMTVCVAVMFTHQGYPGIVAASDRMLTATDIAIEYEHPISKYADFGNGVAILVAGNMVVHTAVIYATRERIRVERLTEPLEIAEAYAAELRAYANKKAEQYYLAPVGMTISQLMSSDKLESPTFQDMYNHVTRYADSAEMDVQAMVIGATKAICEICAIDNYGRVTRHSDIGFHAIGIGVSHASGHLMQVSACNTQDYYQALWRAYSAKRRAEIAPGVGDKTTDLLVVYEGRATPLAPNVLERLQAEWAINENHRLANEDAAIDSLRASFPSTKAPPPPPDFTTASEPESETNATETDDIIADAPKTVEGNAARAETTGGESGKKTSKKSGGARKDQSTEGD